MITVGKKRVTPVEKIAVMARSISSMRRSGRIEIDAGEAVHLKIDETGGDEDVVVGCRRPEPDRHSESPFRIQFRSARRKRALLSATFHR